MIFFYEKPDGKIIRCDEKYAQQYEGRYKQLGASNGETFKQKRKEGQEKTKALSETVKRNERMVERFQEKREQLVFDDLLSEDDPKVLLVDQRIKEAEEKISEAAAEYRSAAVPLHEEAWDAELEIARGNIIKPPTDNFQLLSGSSNARQDGTNVIQNFLNG